MPPNLHQSPQTVDDCHAALKSMGWSFGASLSSRMGKMVWAVHIHRGQEWRVAYADTELEAFQQAVKKAE